MKTNIGTFLQKLREAGYTLEEIASKIDVSTQTISKLLSGKMGPSVETLIRIAEAFSVTTDAVLGREPATVQENVKKPWQRMKATCETSSLTT
jgi:transcriptional regulator with XRE-family HTH domain